MSNTPIRLASSTDSHESVGSPMSHSSFAKATIARLKEHLNDFQQLKVLDLITTPPVVSSPSLPAPTILDLDGSIDIPKFTDSMLQANIMMSRALADRSVDQQQQFCKNQHRRSLENPPCLKNGATYADYFRWIDPMLSNLKRHPDFRYEFLIMKKPSTTTPENQFRLDQIYDIIRDKLDFSVSQNPKLQHLLSSCSTSDQISEWWDSLQLHFFPITAYEQQQRELRFYGLVQKSTESLSNFLQRSRNIKICGSRSF